MVETNEEPVTSVKTTGNALRGGAEAARQVHTLKADGSNPSPATTNRALALGTQGSAYIDRMQKGRASTRPSGHGGCSPVPTLPSHASRRRRRMTREGSLPRANRPPNPRFSERLRSHAAGHGGEAGKGEARLRPSRMGPSARLGGAKDSPGKGNRMRAIGGNGIPPLQAIGRAK